MRSHIRQLIHRARQGKDAGRAMDRRREMDRMAAEAVRLARLASAVHRAEAAQLAARGDGPGDEAISRTIARREPRRELAR